MKTVSPELTNDSDRDRVRSTLAKEVAILRPLSHRCLPQVFEHALDLPLPYYVCTFHSGSTLEQFRKNRKRLKLDEAIFVIVSLIDVIEYIHSHGRTHCDLHEDNILLNENVFAEGPMIIDFGSGHRESASGDDTPDRGHLDFKGVEGQARFRLTVRRDDVSEDFRANDMRALGRALALMESCFFSAASHEQLQSYRGFARLLQSAEFDSWAHVREHFDHVIDPDNFMTKTQKYFVMQDGSRPQITLPAGRDVDVGEAVLAIVNTTIFQRLRTIKQLAFCEWYFPGGVHSRFEHSLGVFGTACEAVRALSRDVNFKARFNQANVDGTLISALIHDIGHYPYSHVVEHYVAGRYPDDRDIRNAIHHVNHTLHLLDTDEELRDAIARQWGEGASEEAKRVLLGKRPPLSDLLDSAVDCDKLDYLRRDAHHCGVPFGQGLDITGVIRSLRCSSRSDELIVDAAHVHAIEGFMVVQDQMLGSVYWHPTIRSVFAMFHRFLDGALGNSEKKLIQFVDELKSCNNEYEAIHRAIIPLLRAQPKTASKTHGTQAELEPLVRLHWSPSFNDIYRQVASYSHNDRANPKHPDNVFNAIVRLPTTGATNMPILWDKVKRLRACYAEAFREKKVDIGRFEVLVDVPWGKASNRIVTVVEEDGVTERPITEVTHLASTIFTHPTAYSAPVRVYISPKLAGVWQRSSRSIQASAEERFFFGGGGVGEDTEFP